MVKIITGFLGLLLSISIAAQPKNSRQYQRFYDHFQQGDFKSAIRIGKNFLSPGNETAAYTDFILALSIAYLYSPDFLEAEPLAGEALRNVYRIEEHRKKNTAADDDYENSIGIDGLCEALFTIYSPLADYYIKEGKPEKAESIYKKTIPLSRHFSFTEQYFRYAQAQLGLYLEMNRFKDAEAIAATTMNEYLLRRDTLSFLYANFLHQYANMYAQMGKFNYCIYLYEKASAIIKKTEGATSTNYMASLAPLSYLYYRMGSSYWKKADSLSSITSTIATANKSTYPNEYFTILLIPLYTFITDGQYAKADSICRLLDVSLKNVTPAYQQEYRANYIDRLAYYEHRKGNYAKADSLYNLSLRLQEAHPAGLTLKYAWTLQGQGSLYLTNREYDRAERIFSQRNIFQLKELRKDFPTLSSASKISYLENNYFNTLSATGNCLLYRYPNCSRDFKVQLFNIELLTKSLVLDQTSDLLKILKSEKDTSLPGLFYKWKALRKQINAQRLLKDGSLPISEAMEREADLLESSISQRSAKFKAAQQVFSVTMKDVQDKLDADEAAIEFVQFRVYNTAWTDSTMYGVYLVKKNSAEPLFIPLFEQKSLQRIFDTAYNSVIKVPSNDDRGLKLKRKNVNEFNKDLYQLIWKPIEPYLKDIRKIAFAPTGKLYNIAFHSLRKDSSHLLMDLFILRQYTSTRQVALRNDDNKLPVSSAALFGNPLFKMDSLALTTLHKQENNLSGNIIRYTENTEITFLDSLPYTREEVASIDQLLKQRKVITTVYTSEKASEENLKLFDGQSPDVLHIATHGYFTKSKEVNTSTVSSGSDADPLTRTGLYLSGAEYALTGHQPLPGIEDGILTAYEILQLDLSNTKLVILSACKTALGDVKEGEGVYGLQRAFKLAGVKKMIISLWDVPDKATATLMKLFYKHWTADRTVDEAFDLARKEMQISYPSPKDWAAFTLIE